MFISQFWLASKGLGGKQPKLYFKHKVLLGGRNGDGQYPKISDILLQVA